MSTLCPSCLLHFATKNDIIYHMNKENIHIATSEDMEALGATLIKYCQTGGKVFFLYGNLGAGKTTLVRGFLRGLGYQGKVKSPTFTLVESYELPELTIHHFDLYRIADPDELTYIGFRDYIQENSICIFEWPEKAQKCLPSPYISCYIDILKDGRNVTIIEHATSE
ncbi:MAG: tRNA (adenosine(37)-N6)-threonylcarbamoyltransferase complex ATPase subunit type 1 TsaE [Gammaproteobacteria bacterium]